MTSDTICARFEHCEKRAQQACDSCSDRVVKAATRKPWAWSKLTAEQKAFFLMVIAGATLAAAWLADWREMRLLASLLFACTYLSGGFYGTVKGISSLLSRQIDVDLLMILAALGAAVVGAPFEGGMLLFLFSLSNVLQNHALSRSRTAIRSLMQLRPTTVLCETGHETQAIPVESVSAGMTIRLRPGDRIALDGEVLRGESTVDESSLTGESMPVHKSPGSKIFAGTINQNGSITYRATKAAKDSTLARIISLVEEAQEEKANTQRFLDRAERYYASSIILITIGLIAIPPAFFGAEFRESFYRAMTLLVVASPCALIISTPAAFLAAIAGAAKHGVLFKGGVHLERLASVDTIAFDKTGTLTTGQPEVTNVATCLKGAGSEGDQLRRKLELIQVAASIESHSEHPIARAIERHCTEHRCALLEVEGFRSLTGKGASATVAGVPILVGSPGLIEERGGVMDHNQLMAIEALLDEGKTVVMVAETHPEGKVRQLMGWIAVTDTIREDAPEVIRGLKKLGVRRMVMLTGDNVKVARAVGRRVGIDEVHAQLLPQNKLELVRELTLQGTVAMVGDGVNDAPALAKANVGIAMGAAGTDVAMETADVVLMSSRLTHLLNAFALAKKSRTVVVQNLTFALGVIMLLAFGALVGHLPLPLGVVGHEGSTVLVCLNGLRLLAFRYRS
jgi:Cd2+/Zn2+-exporting ATPase